MRSNCLNQTQQNVNLKLHIWVARCVLRENDSRACKSCCWNKSSGEMQNPYANQTQTDYLASQKGSIIAHCVTFGINRSYNYCTNSIIIGQLATLFSTLSRFQEYILRSVRRGWWSPFWKKEPEVQLYWGFTLLKADTVVFHHMREATQPLFRSAAFSLWVSLQNWLKRQLSSLFTLQIYCV